MKLDMEKAFDKLRWMLTTINFPSH